jgi:Mg2+ and Co2+ transporter CorA
MDDLLKDLLEHYNEMIIEMAEKVQDAQDNEDRAYKEKCEYRTKNAEQAKKIEELSRTVSILQRTLKCHNDFIDEKELRKEYEEHQDKWIEQEEQKNG